MRCRDCARQATCRNCIALPSKTNVASLVRRRRATDQQSCAEHTRSDWGSSSARSYGKDCDAGSQGHQFRCAGNGCDDGRVRHCAETGAGGRGTSGGSSRSPGHGPDRASDRRTHLPALDSAGRARCETTGEIRGQGPRRCTQRADRARRRHGLRHAERVRRSDAHADGGSPRQRGASFQPVSHHGTMFAYADRVAVGPQSSPEQHGRRYRNRHGVSGQHRAATEQHRPAGGDAPSERLQHQLLRQEP